MKLGSLCSGIGLLELGLERALGAETIWQVEREPLCRAVLAEHWPNAERFDDVHDVGAPPRKHALQRVDLICFGSPCQNLSSAGDGSGLDGPKSRIFYECARVVGELQPEWLVFENVASGASRWVDAVRSELGKLGYATLPVPIAASDLGAPHRRSRVLLVAHLDREHLRQLKQRQPEGRQARAVCAEGQTVAVRNGQAGPPADTDGDGEHAQSEHAEVAMSPEPNHVADAMREGREGSGPGSHPIRERLTAGCWRAPVPDFLRVVHGSPDWFHAAYCDALRRAGRNQPSDKRVARKWASACRKRIAALGNACTPAQSQVAGEVIRLLIQAEAMRQP